VEMRRMAVVTVVKRARRKRDPRRRTAGFYYLNDSGAYDVGRLPAYSRSVDDEMLINELSCSTVSAGQLRRSTSPRSHQVTVRLYLTRRRSPR
jgi:hypothetical protein